MARSWNGFLAQNQEIMEQWGIMEENRKQLEARMQRLSTGDFEQPPEAEDEDLPGHVTLAWNR